MPIKFRCSYCRQFLGISRGRAGDIVDCPTCGRSIRVPRLDGMVQPLPAPELNLQDTKLVRALDELAHWNAPAPADQADADAAEGEAEVEIPQPLAEPIPIEVPVAPEPIAVKPPPVLESPGTAAQPSSPDSPREPAFSVAAALVELDQLAASPPMLSGQTIEMSPAAATKPGKSRLPVVLIGVCCLVAFGLGALIRSLFIANPPPAVAPVGEGTGFVAHEAAPAVSGRISYKTADGSSLPDKGARILILPREREGALKLSAVGLRAADHPADLKLVTAALRSWGGDLIVTDDGGKFALALANPGVFQIVVISNFARRTPGEDSDPDLMRFLGLYFEQPGQVTGQTKVHFGQIRYKGTGTEIWDHSF